MHCMSSILFDKTGVQYFHFLLYPRTPRSHSITTELKQPPHPTAQKVPQLHPALIVSTLGPTHFHPTIFCTKLHHRSTCKKKSSVQAGSWCSYTQPHPTFLRPHSTAQVRVKVLQMKVKEVQVKEMMQVQGLGWVGESLTFCCGYDPATPLKPTVAGAGSNQNSLPSQAPASQTDSVHIYLARCIGDTQPFLPCSWHYMSRIRR